MPELSATGDIVEHQTYLNGTRYFLVEGTGGLAGAEWLWTFAFTLPKEDNDEITEGDLSLSHDDSAWFAGVAGGRFSETVDEMTDAPVTRVTLDLRRTPEAESTETWQAATATLTLSVDTCLLALEIEPDVRTNDQTGRA